VKSIVQKVNALAQKVYNISPPIRIKAVLVEYLNIILDVILALLFTVILLFLIKNLVPNQFHHSKAYKHFVISYIMLILN